MIFANCISSNHDSNSKKDYLFCTMRHQNQISAWYSPLLQIFPFSCFWYPQLGRLETRTRLCVICRCDWPPSWSAVECSKNGKINNIGIADQVYSTQQVTTYHDSIGHVNVQSCLLINFLYKPISLQFSWLSVEQPIRIDCVFYRHHWQFPINKKTIPMLICQIIGVRTEFRIIFDSKEYYNLGQSYVAEWFEWWSLRWAVYQQEN